MSETKENDLPNHTLRQEGFFIMALCWSSSEAGLICSSIADFRLRIADLSLWGVAIENPHS